MAVQSKTLIGDVGSAVLAESVSQLNRAAGYVTSAVPLSLAAPAATHNMVLCRFSEDVYVTNVTLGFGSAVASFNQVLDAVSLLVGTSPDGATGGTVICSATNFGAAPANNFVTQNVYATMTDFQAVAVVPGGSDAPFAVDAGNSLSLRIVATAGGGGVVNGSQILETVSVTYRPVKDSLTVDPNYTRTMQNFKSSAR